MCAVSHLRNVFSVYGEDDLEACIEWLLEQDSKWQLYYPETFVAPLFNGIHDGKFTGPWLIFIANDIVAVAFKLKFC